MSLASLIILFLAQPIEQVAGDTQAVRGLPVRLRTDPDLAADVAGVGGLASVVTGDQGRFTVPAIAAGKLAVSVDFRWHLPWRSSLLVLNRPQVQPTKITDVRIPLRPAAHITGIVREIPSGRPVAGVGVAVAWI